MTPTTIRLAHPELCEACAALLPTGTVVLVDPSLHVTCPECGTVARPAVDPWAWVHDPDLRHRLQHRHEDRVLVERSRSLVDA